MADSIHNNADKLYSIRIKKLKIVIVITATYLLIQVLFGFITGSLALLADAAHMLTDVAGLALSLFAMIYSKKPSTAKHNYGYYRTEILATLVNSLVLILLSFYIIFEAYHRITNPQLEVIGFPMLIVATIGLVLNLASMKILGSHDHLHGHNKNNSSHSHSNKDKKIPQLLKAKDQSLNMQGASLEVLSDTLGSLGVVVAAIIILTTNFTLADPLVSIGLALFILPRTWSLLKKAVHILLEGVPASISYEEVKDTILQIKGVTGIFDLRIWSITSGMHALSAHVIIMDITKSQLILKEINAILENKYGIINTTIQIELYHV